MNIVDTIPMRHSVRHFLEKPVHPAKIGQLSFVAEQCNQSYGLHLQLITEDPEVFAGQKTFENAVNYIALVGPKGSQEALGYCGEMLVLKAQSVGLNTCWVAGTYHKRKVKAVLDKGEKLYGVIPFGYGKTPGKPHKPRKLGRYIRAEDPLPQWFLAGVCAAMLAPTALGLQSFKFILRGDHSVKLRSYGFCRKLNRGILKYHFEQGAGGDFSHWA